MNGPFERPGEDVDCHGTSEDHAPVLLRMTAPLREGFAIPYHDLGPREAKPRVALISGLHGNEVNGVFVLSRLANYVSGIAAGKYPGQELAGRVIIVPAVNVLGLNMRTREWPFDKTDINRMFPGYDAGETTQRIANAVVELTRQAHFRIDVHSSNDEFEELSQVRLYEPSEAERRTAWLFGLPAIIERPINKIFSVTLGHAWRNWGGENFIVQSGLAGGLQPEHCEVLFKSFVQFLAQVGVLKGVDLSNEEETHHFGLDQGFPLISEKAGIFVTKKQVGSWLLAGAIIGYIYNGFDGKLIETVKAPVAGMLTGLRRQPLLFEGDLLARIQTRHPTKQRIETYLQGHGQ